MHKAAVVRARLERAGLRLLYLPRYSPEFSPIEPCGSKVKERLRTKAARTVVALNEALGPCSTPSPPAMPAAGSATVATPPLQSDLQTA